MRRLPWPVVVLAVLAAVGPLWASPLPAAPPSSAVAALSGLDFVPARNDLDRLFQGDVAALVGLANGTDEDDPGIRLRAYRSLRHFAGDPVATEGLRDAVARYRGARQGTELLYLIAALDALGESGDASDVDTVAPLLDAGESRDLRAAAARALGRLGTTTACSRLRARSAVEPQRMVSKAIDRALQHPDCQNPG